MQRTVRVDRDKRQVHVDRLRRGELFLRLLGRFLQSLQSHLILAEIYAVLILEAVGDEIHQRFVEVVAAQAGIAVGGQHFKHAVADLQQAYVERAAAQVVHQNLLAAFLVQAIGQRRSGRLVDDTQHFRPAMRPASLVAWRWLSLK